MATNGWIKLHRKSVENPMYFDEPFDKWHAWTDLLLMVNHEKKQFISKGQLITLEPGQTVTSMAILAERWKWSVNKVRRFIGILVGTGMCTVNGTPNGTTITVVKWAFYQCEGQTNGITNGTTHGTSNGTTGGTLTRNKRKKEGKKGAAPKPPTDEPDPYATDDEGIRRYLEAEEAKGRWKVIDGNNGRNTAN